MGLEKLSEEQRHVQPVRRHERDELRQRERRAENRGRRHASLVLPHVGEERTAVHVADRVDALDIGAGEAVFETAGRFDLPETMADDGCDGIAHETITA